MDGNKQGKNEGDHVEARRREITRWVEILGVANGEVLRGLTGLPRVSLDRHLRRLVAEGDLRCLGHAQVGRSDPLRGVWYATRRRRPRRPQSPERIPDWWEEFFAPKPEHIPPLRIHTAADRPWRENHPLRLVMPPPPRGRAARSPRDHKAGEKAFNSTTQPPPVGCLLRKHAAWSAEVARWLVVELGALTRHTGHRVGLISERLHRLRERARLRGSRQSLDVEENERGRSRGRHEAKAKAGPKLTMVPDLFVAIDHSVAFRVEVELSLKSRGAYVEAHRRRLLLTWQTPLPVLYIIVDGRLHRPLQAGLEGISEVTIVRYGDRAALDEFIRGGWPGFLAGLTH